EDASQNISNVVRRETVGPRLLTALPASRKSPLWRVQRKGVYLPAGPEWIGPILLPGRGNLRRTAEHGKKWGRQGHPSQKAGGTRSTAHGARRAIPDATLPIS